jgi:hypothetical protein
MMKINGHNIHLLLDTGAATTVLFAQRVPYINWEKDNGQRFTSLSGHMLLAKVKDAHTEVGDAIKLDGTNVFIADGRNMTAMPFDGIMATWTPQRHKIAFDFQRLLFSWESDEAPARNSPPATLTAMSEQDAPAPDSDALIVERRTSSERDSGTGNSW